MNCPKCKYDLRGNENGKCPECGVHFAVVDPVAQKMPTALLYTGIGFIAFFCLVQTIWFWKDLDTFNYLVNTSGLVDPTGLARSVRISLALRYASNISLGIGMCCIALSLFKVFRSVLVAIESAKTTKIQSEHQA